MPNCYNNWRSYGMQGEDVGELQQESLRRHLAVVPQDTVLLNDTILENIRYGDLSASDEEVYTLPAACHGIPDLLLSFNACTRHDVI